ERISVFCGPFLREEGGSVVVVKPEPQGENSAETEFLEAMYQRTVDLNTLIEAKRQGQLSVTVPVNLDINLQDNFVLSKAEFLIRWVTGTEATDRVVTGQINSVDRYLMVAPSTEVIYDESVGDAGGTPGKVTPVGPVTAKVLQENGLEEPPAAKVPPLLQTA